MTPSYLIYPDVVGKRKDHFERLGQTRKSQDSVVELANDRANNLLISTYENIEVSVVGKRTYESL